MTFTEAAAAEMRQRIRQRLEEEALRQPAITHWQEQLALFESAHIGTLHSFCLQLVRQHFYQLELDPQLTVLPQEEARLLADETLDGLLQKYYAGRDPAAEGVQQLIHAQGGGSDDRIRWLVLRLHEYSQTLPDAEGWLGTQLGMFQISEPTQWRVWLNDGIVSWRLEWLATLERLGPGNRLAQNCTPILQRVTQQSAQTEIAEGLAEILQAEKDFPRGNKAALTKPLKDLFADAAFLLSLIAVPQALAEDWDWVRGQMATLLEMTRQFSAAFHEAKRELGVVDFHDLEQGALELLWDRQKEQPTAIAEQWRRQLRFIFVDEYQDINAAQDKIIEALSRSGTDANRFLVGDIKQSIYRFRLANPYIFQGYVRQWRDGSGRVIPLVENFRSREGLLEFINSLFERLMRPNLGGLAYDEEARLRFGAVAQRPTLAANGEPCVEWHIRLKVADDYDDGEEPGLEEVRELQEAEKEARLLGLRLRELRARRHP
ncbi:MAG: UvrD-helicase domain-containing protein, partial [Limisphaerales bacterium]